MINKIHTFIFKIITVYLICSGVYAHLAMPITIFYPHIKKCQLGYGVLFQLQSFYDDHDCCFAHKGICRCEEGRAICCDDTPSPHCICSRDFIVDSNSYF